VGRLRQALQGQKIYLDTNIFIYSVEMIAPWANELNDIFVGLKSSEFSAVTSNLSLSECLVIPFKQNRQDLVQVYRKTFLSRSYLNVSPINNDILIFAANVRAQTNLKLPDAIHAATALTQHCTAMLTNDAGFNRVPNIDIFLLSDWITPSC
jgi:predicted nucleic acid-binding protein